MDIAMAIHLPPLFPKRPSFAGGTHPPEVLTISAAGVVVDTEGRGVADIRIRFTDRLTGAGAAYATTDLNGRFAAELRITTMGYTATPVSWGWGFSPGSYDFTGDIDMRFTGTYLAKAGDGK
jgi:hypothetical protein